MEHPHHLAWRDDRTLVVARTVNAGLQIRGIGSSANLTTAASVYCETCQASFLTAINADSATMDISSARMPM
jgi:hypothetical protein